MKEGIIFDLDGVLVQTDEYHYQAWKMIADEIGIYFDQQINHRLRGVSRMESLDIILENSKTRYDLNIKKQLADKKNEYYKTLLEKMSEADVSHEVRDTLAELKERDYLLAIGSSSKNAKFILEKTGLTDMFEAISDGTNIKYSKPHPEVFQKAAKYLKLPAELCCVVEDAEAGIIAAKKAGMKAIGIGDAARSEQADIKLQCFEELLVHLK